MLKFSAYPCLTSDYKFVIDVVEFSCNYPHNTFAQGDRINEWVENPAQSQLHSDVEEESLRLTPLNVLNHSIVFCEKNTEADIPLARRRCRLLSKF
jgi:hypothetical protein